MLKWEQVPKKARLLLARLEQYVMWLDYREFAYASLLELHPQNRSPNFPGAAFWGFALCP